MQLFKKIRIELAKGVGKSYCMSWTVQTPEYSLAAEGNWTDSILKNLILSLHRSSGPNTSPDYRRCIITLGTIEDGQRPKDKNAQVLVHKITEADGNTESIKQGGSGAIAIEWGEWKNHLLT